MLVALLKVSYLLVSKMEAIHAYAREGEMENLLKCIESGAVVNSKGVFYFACLLFCRNLLRLMPLYGLINICLVTFFHIGK